MISRPHKAGNLLSSVDFESESLVLHIKNAGASLAGIGDVSIGLAKEFQHLPGAISLGIHHPAIERKSEHIYSYFPFYPSIDRRLLKIEKELVRQLRFAGWRALAIPPDSNRFDNSFISRLYPLFPHKTAATCAGLGWVGKSGLLVNEKYGPCVNWATVLTDAPLETCNKPILQSRCGNCRKCVDTCPAGAISDKQWIRVDENSYQPMIDIEKCSSQLKVNGKKFGISTCGVCILVCPLGSFSD